MTQMLELPDLTLRQQIEGLSQGAFDHAELLQAYRDRIAQRDGRLLSVVHMCDLEKRATQHPSIPIGIKDIIDVAGAPTRCGSHAAETTAARTDATCVTRLRDQGLLPFAKLATYEYALTGPAFDQPDPPARNPWNTAYITGGSSSGSAAAVAGGLFRAALGTDTGGSIRAPAAYCGIVGLKPTWATVETDGVFPLSPSLDVVGPLAACVEDAAFVLDALRPNHPRPTLPHLKEGAPGHIIGYARDWFVSDPACDPAVVSAMDDAAATLSTLGYRIELINLPDYALAEIAGTVILQAEALAIHRSPLKARFDSYGVDARRNLLTGTVLDDADLANAKSHAAYWKETIDGHLARCAALLSPTTLSPAPPFAAFEDGAVWTAMRTLPFNMTGHPAISVPCGFSKGLPLGMQLVGRPDDEAGLCQIAYRFEQATDFGAYLPPF